MIGMLSIVLLQFFAINILWVKNKSTNESFTKEKVMNDSLSSICDILREQLWRERFRLDDNYQGDWDARIAL